MQTSFQKSRSTKTAIIKTLTGIKDGNNFIAVLDLRGAYGRMPSHLLCRRLDRFLPHWLANMTKYFLQPAVIYTAGGTSRTQLVVNDGVPQGSPLSPTLFNVFMDSLAEGLGNVPQPLSKSPATFYADNVILRAQNARGLQALLDIASNWARLTGMMWNTKPEKSMILHPKPWKT